MEKRESQELLLLLEDYGRSVRRRAAAAGSVDLPPSDRPIWLRVEQFGDRGNWQASHGTGPAVLPPSDAPAPEFLVERFDPIRRLKRAASTGAWTADPATSVDFDTPWHEGRFRGRTVGTKAVSALLHAAVAAVALIPGIRQLDLTEPADWDSLRITLMSPNLDDLPPLVGQVDVPGLDEDGSRGVPMQAPEPEPGPAPEPKPEPESKEESEVAQPIETEEPEPAEEPAAVEEPEEPVVAELATAQSPSPGEFRRGRELAENRDSRLLPMPKAPSRKAWSLGAGSSS